MWNFFLSIVYFLIVFMVAFALSQTASDSQSAVMASIFSAGAVIYAIIRAHNSISKKLDILLEERGIDPHETDEDQEEE
ncbi:MAG: hypothetical protein R3Y45_05440 [Bacillota bacterium]